MKKKSGSLVNLVEKSENRLSHIVDEKTPGAREARLSYTVLDSGRDRTLVRGSNSRPGASTRYASNSPTSATRLPGTFGTEHPGRSRKSKSLFLPKSLSSITR